MTGWNTQKGWLECLPKVWGKEMPVEDDGWWTVVQGFPRAGLGTAQAFSFTPTLYSKASYLPVSAHPSVGSLFPSGETSIPFSMSVWAGGE